jgi:hypothetical protein
MNLVTYHALDMHLSCDWLFRTEHYSRFITLNTKRKSGKQITMVFIPDPAFMVNHFQCAVILVLGYLIYRKRNSISVLLIGLAFGIFGYHT